MRLLRLKAIAKARKQADDDFDKKFDGSKDDG
jgi:hypothetical protein